MDAFQGIADVVERLVYEVMGLVIPGAALVFGGAAALGPEAWQQVLAFAANHPWLTVAGVYVVGYPLQGISRPITNLVRLPSRLFRCRPVQAQPPEEQGSVLRVLERVRAVFLSGHGPVPESVSDPPDGQEADFLKVLSRYWTSRLALPDGARLSSGQVIDLSFSALLPDRRQLDRFRAATSLARGVAAALVLVLSLLVAQLLAETRGVSGPTLLVLAGGLIAVYGLLQRADMYARLWRSVVLSQALAVITQSGPLRPKEERRAAGN